MLLKKAAKKSVLNQFLTNLGVSQTISSVVGVVQAIVVNPIIRKVGLKTLITIATGINCTRMILYGIIR